MSSKPFRFKQFTIDQDQCAMKVGMDGVLLGAWADLSKSKLILDIGCGTGLIALMAAQRRKNVHIDAIELDRDTYLQALENISISKWNQRIKVFNEAIQKYDDGKSYDTILSNPPYFQQGNKPPKTPRDTARNSKYLTSFELIESVNRLLLPDGTFSMIYPNNEGKEFIGLAFENGLFVSKQTLVRSRKDMPVERLLIQFKKDKCAKEDDDLIIYRSALNHPDYTNDYISMTKDFYLYM